ncbi:PhzF family phenazine biosynthesis protein [Rivihabitans pingtungensis]|jgi:PhzF family phenazine biosynthesis protein|uniref:PhzF family phenazine biosynthesis protein n=1 Tax=Rivihabitans pingtungensis TaxID=1054498 RepID=UPI00289B88A3|nr:PhzF family phenazine biosynthesis protein [Rivihabitans pingtungensis]
MTTPRAYHLVNVFAETRFGGNPLAVFEDGSGLTDAEMQAIAAQMNLSETVFLFPPRLPGCDAHVRIFTPGYELPFAGHPTLGSAAMVRRLGRGGDHVQLGMAAGVFPVRAEGERWQLAAKSPVAQPWVTHTHHLAGALGLSPNEVRAARLIDCGTEQLLVEVCCRETVLNCRPDARLLEAYCRNRQGVAMAYVWHIEQDVATVRLFFTHHGQVVEDPGTGSACANLGGWLQLAGKHPLTLRVEQGHALKRPNVLHLAVDAAGEITVAGEVIWLGQGVLHV